MFKFYSVRYFIIDTVFPYRTNGYAWFLRCGALDYPGTSFTHILSVAVYVMRPLRVINHLPRIMSPCVTIMVKWKNTWETISLF